MKAEDGFTLLECLIIISFMGLLIKFSGLKRVNSITLRQEAQLLSSLIGASALESIQREERINLKLFTGGYTISRPEFGTRIQRHYDFKTPITSLPSSAQEINFYPSSSVSPASITLGDGAQTCKLSISIRGRVNQKCS